MIQDVGSHTTQIKSLVMVVNTTVTSFIRGHSVENSPNMKC